MFLIEYKQNIIYCLILQSDRGKGFLKKLSGKAVLFFSIFCVMVFFAFSVGAKTTSPKVEINGVPVYSPNSYTQNDGVVMVDVESFFNVMKTDFEYNHKNKTIAYRDKEISVKTHKGSLVASFEDLSDLINATSTKTKADGTKYALVLPEGTIKLTESYINMGEHWANPEEDIFYYDEEDSHYDEFGEPIPVFKTIYGVYEGELVFLEQMIAQTYMEGSEARDWINVPGMKGLPSPAIVQTDIEFRPTGHANYEIPHYDFHHYFITDEEQHKIEGQDLHHD